MAITGPILLPSKPALRMDSPTMLDWGGTISPPLGGPTQTILRLGTRHALEFELPRMRTEPNGRIWSAKLRLAKLYGALLPFGQDGLAIGVPGAPVAEGGGQSGSTLALRGFAAGYTVAIGQAFSLIHNGRRYLHFAAEQAVANASGRLSLAILPMLRVIVDDGDGCEFAQPMIQGALSGNSVKWTRMTSPFCDFGSITITEEE